LSWAAGFEDVAAALLAADRQVARGAGRRILLDSLRWRSIEVIS
jgi:hypothetical protein